MAAENLLSTVFLFLTIRIGMHVSEKCTKLCVFSEGPTMVCDFENKPLCEASLERLDLCAELRKEKPEWEEMSSALEIINLSEQTEHIFQILTGSCITHLRIQTSHIKQLPNLKPFKRVSRLSLEVSAIDMFRLDSSGIKSYGKLEALHVSFNELVYLEREPLKGMKQLKHLYITETLVKDIENATILQHLETLSVYNSRLESVPYRICDFMPNLTEINLAMNHIQVLGNFGYCKHLVHADFSGNDIGLIRANTFRGMTGLGTLSLGNNRLKRLDGELFKNMKSITYLDLSYNEIEYMDENIFAEMMSIERLKLNNNKLTALPVKGLKGLMYLNVAKNTDLQDYPPPKTLPTLYKLTVSYPYDCCGFIEYFIKHSKSRKPLEENGKDKQKDRTYKSVEAGFFLIHENIDEGVITNYSNFIDPYMEVPHNETKQEPQRWYSLEDDIVNDVSGSALKAFEHRIYTSRRLAHHRATRTFQCIPKPGPFTPCRDLLGHWWLRAGIWTISGLTVLVNGLVIIVYAKTGVQTASRFLIHALAFSDLIMGVYLLILAWKDAATANSFKRYGLTWQQSGLCKFAGFSAVLSSELTLFIITSTTIERCYGVLNAMRFKPGRMTVQQAAFVVSIGVAVCGSIAAMPLFGVSEYTYAICLPFQIGTANSKLFLTTLMLGNMIELVIILACYVAICVAIRSTWTWNIYESRITKRMSLLILTNFGCWTPIILISLVYLLTESQLITLEQTKTLAVFILPINAAANPFLYAIWTTKFRRELREWCCLPAFTRIRKRTSIRNLAKALSIKERNRRKQILLRSNPTLIRRRPSPLIELFELKARKNTKVRRSTDNEGAKKDGYKTIGASSTPLLQEVQRRHRLSTNGTGTDQESLSSPTINTKVSIETAVSIHLVRDRGRERLLDTISEFSAPPSYSGGGTNTKGSSLSLIGNDLLQGKIHCGKSKSLQDVEVMAIDINMENELKREDISWSPLLPYSGTGKKYKKATRSVDTIRKKFVISRQNCSTSRERINSASHDSLLSDDDTTIRLTSHLNTNLEVRSNSLGISLAGLGSRNRRDRNSLPQ